ncbi:GNAT family N-acetyltransferase [Halalkalibacter urbisdiaboli]|uniref:GNAT family N-acetyltransferase n=1 Tax=Halalkalibacter urbisdiaboli TaxID=1960589 RepID=UPI000B44E258|nr:GNAT family protein [Halalkalibacter urbisdiaboli]
MFVHTINEDLALKLIGIDDAEQIFNLTIQNRDHLREWLPWIDQSNHLDDTTTYIKSCLTGFAKNDSLQTVIIYKNQYVGVAGFNQLNWGNKTGHIGYWLGNDFQGKGIMTTVVQALTDYGFNNLMLNKVEIRAAEANRKSRSIPERLGFKHEGTIRSAQWLYDHYVDMVIYGMLKNEWNKAKR